MSERVSIIISTELKKDIDELKKWMEVDQSTIIRQLLSQAIREKKIEIAISEYKKNKISFGKAADLAGLNIWEFIDEVHRRNIPMNYSLEDVQEGIQKIREGVYDKYISKKF